MKKIFVMLGVLVLSFSLVSCGGDDDVESSGTEENSMETATEKVEDKLVRVDSMPEWLKELKLDEPEGMKLVYGDTDDGTGIKTVSLIYVGSLEKAEAEGKKIAQKAGLVLDENFKGVPTGPKKKTPKMIMYSNFDSSVNTNVINDNSKYMKSVIVEELVDGKISFEGQEFKGEAILGVNVLDPKILDN